MQAPTPYDDLDQCEMGEELYDEGTVDFEDLEVAAHEVVETNGPAVENDDVDGRLHRLETMMENFIARQPSEACPTSSKDDECDKPDFEPSPDSSSNSKTCNIRWDLIPKFPKDIPSNKLWENWQSFIENFEIAASLSTFAGSADRAKLLYLSLGKNLQDIIGAADLRPDYRDPKCYSKLVDGVNKYFRSMTDTAAEHDAFLAMRQMDGEPIVAFHARLRQMVRLCDYSPSDQVRFVLAQLLTGMRNQELALVARTYEHDANKIVQAATRVETYEASKHNVMKKSAEVMAVNRKRESNREREPPSKMRKEEDNREYEARKSRGPPREHRQGQRTRCWRCGFLFHKNKICPALDKQCSTCRKVGHFAVTCRNKVKRTGVNNIQGNPRDHKMRSPSPAWGKRSGDEQV